MTMKQANLLPLGLYELIWKEGGSSLAAVGYNSAGDHWYAPTNWISVPCMDWDRVECVIPVRLETRAL